MRIFATYLRIYFLIMSCILNIETSTDVCSVAISDSGQVIFNQEDHTGPNHAVKLGGRTGGYLVLSTIYVDGVFCWHVCLRIVLCGG